MSADNMIYIQKRHSNWYIWMGFASDTNKPKPPKNSASFKTYKEAKAYALGWLRGEDVVEYGIIQLTPLNGLGD